LDYFAFELLFGGAAALVQAIQFPLKLLKLSNLHPALDAEVDNLLPCSLRGMLAQLGS